MPIYEYHCDDRDCDCMAIKAGGYTSRQPSALTGAYQFLFIVEYPSFFPLD